ncbi:MAG TPA: formyltransferase family protein [Verrucomicrobiae bacterium]|jgi:methionyl-tRNA formyltransferase|nr:formyltransferase family protein [Verrucomicrobiae bacterium]
MRIFFLGNNWLGWQVLKWLRSGDDEIVGLALHPEAKSKCGKEIYSEIDGTNCVVVDGSRLRDPEILEQIAGLRAEFAVSILFGYILSAEFIELFPSGCINLHPALLPYNRGAFPNVWSIVKKEPAGVTLHYVDRGIDTGDIIAQKEIAVDVTDTGGTLYRKLEQEGLELFKQHWPAIRAGTCSHISQPLNAGSFHRAQDVAQIDEIDLKKSYVAEDLINIIRARTFSPYTGAYFLHGGRKIYLRLALSDDPNEEKFEGERD